MSFALIGNEGVDFLFRECRVRWTVVSVAVWCCFKRHTNLGNWSCSCTPYLLANMLLSLLKAVHYDDNLYVRSSRRYTMYETKSASVGILSGLPMNSLNSGPIHGRTVSTMPVLQQNHCGACPSPVGGPFASYILQHVTCVKKKWEKGKKFSKFSIFRRVVEQDVPKFSVKLSPKKTTVLA